MADYLVWPLDTLERVLYATQAFKLRDGYALKASAAQVAALAVKGDSPVDRYAVLGPEGLQVFDLSDPEDAGPGNPSRLS